MNIRVKMNVAYIFTISGSSFVKQLAALYKISMFSNDQFFPSLMVGASGGNVVAYIGLAANFNRTKIVQYSSLLRTTHFVSNWIRGPLQRISRSVGLILFGALYKPSVTIVAFLQRLFPKGQGISDVEIVTMSTSVDTGAPYLVSNKSSSEFDGVIPLSGNIDAIAKYGLASAAIPGIITPILIDGDRMMDGGIYSPSPFSPLKSQFLHKNFKLVYFTHTPGPIRSSIIPFRAITCLTKANYEKELIELKDYANQRGMIEQTVSLFTQEKWQQFQDAEDAVLLLTVPFTPSTFSILNIIKTDKEIMKYVDSIMCILFIK